MDDYISRKTAIKRVEELHDCYNGFSDTYDKACIIGVLEEIPSALVREVRRGRWIIHEDLPYSECPFCNVRWSHITENFRYCFYCGADLREESE